MKQYVTLPQKLARKMSIQTNENGKMQVITPKCYNKDTGELLTGLWHPTTMIREIDDMIKTTNRLELWEWIRDENPPEGKGYMFWNHKNVNDISNGLENNNHSGASFAMCMRQIQYIAKNNWETWNEQNARLNKKKKMSASKLRDKKIKLERPLGAARKEQEATDVN